MYLLVSRLIARAYSFVDEANCSLDETGHVAPVRAVGPPEVHVVELLRELVERQQGHVREMARGDLFEDTRVGRPRVAARAQYP